MILLVIGAVAIWPEEREPEYKGKKLSECLRILRISNTTLEAQREAMLAVRAIGTNAMPQLLKWLRYERPAWKDRAAAAYKKFPRALVASSLDSWLMSGKAEVRADAAMNCFQFLGPEAAPAVPELICILKDPRTPVASRRAIVCLGYIGPKARPALPFLRHLTKGFPSGVAVDATIAIHNIEPMDMPVFR